MALDSCSVGQPVLEDDIVSLVLPRCKGRPKASICLICADVIKDATSRRDGQDAILCDGACKSWLHRGLNKHKFSVIAISPLPFHCPTCRLDLHEREISSLKASLLSLTTALHDIEKLVQVHPSGTLPVNGSVAGPVLPVSDGVPSGGCPRLGFRYGWLWSASSLFACSWLL